MTRFLSLAVGVFPGCFNLHTGALLLNLSTLVACSWRKLTIFLIIPMTTPTTEPGRCIYSQHGSSTASLDCWAVASMPWAISMAYFNVRLALVNKTFWKLSLQQVGRNKPATKHVMCRTNDGQQRDHFFGLNVVCWDKHLESLQVGCDCFFLHMTNGPGSSHDLGLFVLIPSSLPVVVLCHTGYHQEWPS